MFVWEWQGSLMFVREWQGSLMFLLSQTSKAGAAE